MTAGLSHRGPDGAGFHLDGPIALGHRRLAIIDLQGGNQPIYNEDRTLAVILNGEIYNYRELRAELAPRHTFTTQSDTEVLVHLYEDHGSEMVGRLRGMFAFALWDSRKQLLFAARDRFGEKPFLYTFKDGGFLFASELDALRANQLVDEEIDREALSDFLELLYIPAPRTIFRRVHKLAAGHALQVDRDGLRISPYWKPPEPGSQPRRVPAGGEVRAALEEAIHLQLRSDVPVAALLSGGLDSSSVVALMAQELGPRLKTFSVGFGRHDDELPFARGVAERFRTEHHEITISDEVPDQVRLAFSAFGEPFGDSSAVPTMVVCREVAKHCKVVLSGDGGDELFAGYGRYRQVQQLPHLPLAGIAADLVDRLPNFPRKSTLRRGARAVGARSALRIRALTEVFSPAERQALLGRDARTAELGPDLPSHADSAIGFDLGVYLPDDLLYKVDAASMSYGLETRCPLLDHRLAELVVPPAIESKQDRSRGKLLLRAALGDLLPAEVLARPKRGFGSPVDQWLSGPLRPLVSDLLRPTNARIKAWLAPRAVDEVIDGFYAGGINPHRAWALLSLEMWARRGTREAVPNSQ